VANQIAKGIELIEDNPGSGQVADKGAVVTCNIRIFLRRGDEVTQDYRSIDSYRSHLQIRIIDGIELIDHTTTLGKRQPIAGVEKSLYGMQAGGFREVVVSPHLGYREVGIPDIIPPNAILRIKLWVHDVQMAT